MKTHPFVHDVLRLRLLVAAGIAQPALQQVAPASLFRPPREPLYWRDIKPGQVVRAGEGGWVVGDRYFVCWLGHESMIAQDVLRRMEK